MKNKIFTFVLLILFFIGLSLLLYPTVSDYWNSFHQSRAIAGYAEAVEELDEEAYEKCLADARAYNAELVGDGGRFQPTAEETARYNSLLDIAGNGIMGYIEIPSIGVSLPVYHGVEQTVLQIAIGHIEGSSLPVGGPGTHCAVSGHRGLPSAKLFTDLDKMAVGDVFMMHVLNETLTYEVDQIRIVEPQETDLLQIEDGQDLCTLVTCTPYGINTHRLLVRGHRVAGQGESTYVTGDAVQIDATLIAAVVTVPVLLVLVAILLVRRRKRPGRFMIDHTKKG